MSDFIFGFNAIDLPDAQDFSPLPAGEYFASIENAELKDTKDGFGKYLSLELLILKDPAHEGRKVWENLNLKNKSDVAERIAKARLKQYMQALQLQVLQAPEQLISGLVRIKTTVKDDKTNIVKVMSFKVSDAQENKLSKPAPKKVEVSPTSTQSTAPAKRASWAA